MFCIIDCFKKILCFVVFFDYIFFVYIIRFCEECILSLVVVVKVLLFSIFVYYLGIILIKFELICYVVKEERFCGIILNEGWIIFCVYCIENNMECVMSNLVVDEVVGGLVNVK